MLPVKTILSLVTSLVIAASSGFSYALQIEGSAACQTALAEAPLYKYPYAGLDASLRSSGLTSIKIFSYGSLMNYDSASRTLSSQTMSSLRPAIAFGVKRVFNRDGSIKPNSRWGVPYSPKARAMLNLTHSDNEDALVNGIAFEVKLDDIAPLMRREVGYDLIPVIMMNWEDALQGKHNCYIAYAFSAPKASKYTHNDIAPRPNYYELSRDATKQYGPIFYSMWFSSTYLSDEITPIFEWEKRVRENAPETQVK